MARRPPQAEDRLLKALVRRLRDAAKEREKRAKARARERAKAAKARARAREKHLRSPDHLATLSPSYRARVERALKEGKSRQEARGHKAGEARRRREREVRREAETGTYTSRHRLKLKRFVQSQAVKAGTDADEAWEDYGEEFQSLPYERWLPIFREQRRLELIGDVRANRMIGTGVIGSLAQLKEHAATFGIREHEWLLFYH